MVRNDVQILAEKPSVGRAEPRSLGGRMSMFVQTKSVSSFPDGEVCFNFDLSGGEAPAGKLDVCLIKHVCACHDSEECFKF